MNGKKIVEKDIFVIGAGASGLMFGALNPKKDFIILESNSKVAEKIRVSGGGRCNITNKEIDKTRYLADASFVDEVLKAFTYRELLSFFDEIEFVKRKKNQFFCKKSSSEVLDFFIKRIDRKKILLNHKVEDVEYEKDRFVIHTNRATFKSKKLIVASGGVSFPQLGVSDIAYKIAKKFGHEITALKPALVGLTLQRDDFWMKKLSGISVEIKVKVGEKEFLGDMLFAHKGISGPVILNSSLYWEKGSMSIDFLPGKKLVLKDKRKQISSNLPLPKRFIKEFLQNLNLKDKVVEKLNKDEIEKLSILKSYKLAPAGDFGYKRAEVTKGGIKTDQIDPKTMQSKLQKGLYFLGECLDVTGELGGYNLHFAFASARQLSLR